MQLALRLLLDCLMVHAAGIITCSTAISVCGKAGQWPLALRLLPDRPERACGLHHHLQRNHQRL